MKTAIITAASKGIGLASAKKLASTNYPLAILLRSSEIHDLANKLGSNICMNNVLPGYVDSYKTTQEIIN